MEDLAILAHRIAQLVSGSRNLRTTGNNRVSNSVFLHNASKTGGNIGFALFKAVKWITACLEKLTDQIVGFCNRGPGMLLKA